MPLEFGWISEQCFQKLYPCPTRSMGRALPMVKEMISKLIKSRSKIPTWVLTSFNDPKVELVKKTNDVKELRSALNQLRYGGGGDVEEQAFQGATYLEYNLKIYVGNINLKYLPFPQALWLPWTTCLTTVSFLWSLMPEHTRKSSRRRSKRKARRKISKYSS